MTKSSDNLNQIKKSSESLFKALQKHHKIDTDILELLTRMVIAADQISNNEVENILDFKSLVLDISVLIAELEADKSKLKGQDRQNFVNKVTSEVLDITYNTLRKRFKNDNFIGTFKTIQNEYLMMLKLSGDILAQKLNDNQIIKRACEIVVLTTNSLPQELINSDIIATNIFNVLSVSDSKNLKNNTLQGILDGLKDYYKDNKRILKILKNIEKENADFVKIGNRVQAQTQKELINLKSKYKAGDEKGRFNRYAKRVKNLQIERQTGDRWQFEKVAEKGAGKASGYQANLVTNNERHMLKSFYKERSDCITQEAKNDRHDGINEIMAADLFEFALTGKAPKEKVVKPGIDDYNKVYYASKFIKNAISLKDFVESPKTLLANINATKLSQLKGFESVIATCSVLGDVDYHAENLMVTHDQEDDTYKVNKIDHGKSFMVFHRTFPDLIKNLHIHLKHYGFLNYINSGHLTFNIAEFNESLKRIVDQLSLDYAYHIIDKRSADLFNIGVALEDYTKHFSFDLEKNPQFKYAHMNLQNAIEEWKHLYQHETVNIANEYANMGQDVKKVIKRWKDIYPEKLNPHEINSKQELFNRIRNEFANIFKFILDESLDKIENIMKQLDVISRMHINDPLFKNGGWIEVMYSSKTLDPIVYAANNNILIRDDFGVLHNPLIWAWENNYSANISTYRNKTIQEISFSPLKIILSQKLSSQKPLSDIEVEFIKFAITNQLEMPDGTKYEDFLKANDITLANDKVIYGNKAKSLQPEEKTLKRTSALMPGANNNLLTSDNKESNTNIMKPAKSAMKKSPKFIIDIIEQKEKKTKPKSKSKSK